MGSAVALVECDADDVVVLGLVGLPPIALKCEYASSRSGSKTRISPLSSYDFPSHSPLKVIGLPTCQSVSISAPR
jgi:hypothetical protein